MELLTIYPGQAGFFFCTEGSAELLINNELYRMEHGVLSIVSPLHTIYMVSKSDDFEWIEIVDEFNVFFATARSVIDIIFKLKLRNKPCLQLNEEEIVFLTERKRLLVRKEKMRNHTNSPEEKDLIHKMIQSLKQEAMLEVIHFFFVNHSLEAQQIEKTDQFVYNFVYSLHQHFKTERSVAFYADEAHLSTGYFTSVIKRKTGRTPSEWISTIIILQSKLLLEKSNKSIKEIASELHFPEQFTFRKYFKQHTGLSPKEYRRQCKERS